MLDITKLSPRILNDLKERGHSPEQIAQMTAKEAFDECCMWEGLLHWGDTLYEWVHHLDKAETK